jgi:hypothetical protein
MISLKYKFLCSLVVGLSLPLSTASAITIGGDESNVSLNDGAFIDGTAVYPQSIFAQELATSQTGMGDIALSELPVIGIGMDLFFSFIYDSQETGNARELDIDDIALTINGQSIWTYDGSQGPLTINDGTEPETATPLGNGADLELFVPISLFNGLTGSDILTFSWTQSRDNNGFDEWVTVGDGFFAPGEVIGGLIDPLDPTEPFDPTDVFDPSDPFDPSEPDPMGPGSEVPEPATLTLLSLGAIALMRRRKASQ